MSQEGPRKKALVIAVSDYDNPSFPTLDFCKNDGEKIYDILTNKCEFQIEDKWKLIGAISFTDMKDAIVDFFRTNVTDSDLLLFYFSGHGVLDGYGGRFFGTTQVDPDIPEKNGLSFSFLSEQMKKSPSTRIVSILDCCFSGGAMVDAVGPKAAGEDEIKILGKEAINKLYEESQGMCILGSSLSQAKSFRHPTEPYSVYTYFLLAGLEGKATDERGFVTPEKLDEYIHTELLNLGEKQKPVRNLSVSGQIRLAHYPDRATTIDPIQFLASSIERLKGTKPNSVEEKARLLEMLLKESSTQSFLHDQSTLSSLFDSYVSKTNEEVLLDKGTEISNENWSFDEKLLFITNKTLWKGIQLRRTIRANTDLTDFWFHFERNAAGVIMATYHPEGPGDEGTAVVSQKTLPKVGTAFHLKYLGNLVAKYFDLLKIIDDSTIMGKCYYGDMESPELLYDYLLTRTYALEYMTEEDHEHLFSKYKTAEGDAMEGVWEGKIINDFSVKIPPLYFRFRKVNNDIKMLVLLEDSTHLSDGVDFAEKEQFELCIETIESFRTINNMILLGSLTVDIAKLRKVFPHIKKSECNQNPMKIRCILKSYIE